MKFGQALEELEAGQRVAREGWNGKNQYVYLHNFEHSFKPFESSFEPVFVLQNAQGKLQPGWLPSMGDLRATDWVVCV